MIEHRQEPATIVGELISFGGAYGAVRGMTAWLIFHVLVVLAAAGGILVRGKGEETVCSRVEGACVGLGGGVGVFI